MKRACVLIGVPVTILALASHAAYAGRPSPQIEAGRPSPQAARAPAVLPPASQRLLVDQYCVTCHNQRLKTGGLALDATDLGNVGAGAETWEKVVRKLRAGVMPPVGRPRPAKEAHEAFVSWLETELDRAAAASPNAGRTEALHRLNRAEYRNAIRDVLALDLDVSEMLPADDGSYGFDNIAGVLKLSQSLMEAYLSAAMKISRIAVGRPLPAPVVEEFVVPAGYRQDEHVTGLPFGTRGGMLVHYNAAEDGEYELSVTLACGPPDLGPCDGSGGFADNHQLEFVVDGARVGLFNLEPRPLGTLAPEKWQVRVPVKAGPRDIGVTFVKHSSIEEVEGLRQRFLRPFLAAASFREQSLAVYQPVVSRLTIAGPFGGTGAPPSELTPSRRRIFECRPAKASEEAACARKIVSTLATRAYRRPATRADVEGLLEFYRAGRAEGDFDAGIERALRKLLASPDFLFRIERDPAGVTASANYRISDVELASRLSFFLWSSVPDDELRDAAARGVLGQPQVLERQVRRMLADDRSQALVSNFAGQWLQLRILQSKRPSEFLYPNFDNSLRQAFGRETELFFESILREDRSVLDLLSADYTFVNERLAKHYGIPEVKGSHFRRVTYADDRRRGLLGQGSILLATSHPIRTSPVLRGRWILENILGTPPPPPPPDVPALEERVDGNRATKPKSMRERMAEHRSNAGCASCHSMIDPAGFALENFDAVGAWRDVDESFGPIDPTGVLPDGTSFSSLGEFRAALASHPERFVGTLTEKLLTYALGRGVEHYDMPAVRAITREAARNNYRLSSIVLGIAQSIPFRMRRAQS